MSPERSSRVLVLVPGALGDRLSGPEIRSTRLARALSSEHQVTLIATGAEVGSYAGMRVLPFSRRRLVREARRHDVLIAAIIPPFALVLKRWLGVVAVSDQYDPVELELGTLGEEAERARETARAARRLQLRSADLVLCASHRQRSSIESEIALQTGGESPPVCVVPFGIDEDPPPGIGDPIREEFAQIGEQDKIVLWWGSLWRWLDPSTAIRAFASLAAERPDLKLVFTSGPPPDRRSERHSVVEEARRLARELGVLDRTVLFLDRWIPYEKRIDYLREADIGLTLHRDLEEAPLAARARYMDYLWAGLPCVLTRGDETAEIFGEAGFATELEPDSPEAVAGAVLGLLEPSANRTARAAGRSLAGEYRWQRVATALLTSLGEIEPELSRSSGWRDTAHYYGRRLADRVGSRALRLSGGVRAGASGIRRGTSAREAGS